MLDFKKFRTAVQKQFDKMSKTGNLFVTGTSKDEIWTTYLGAFPEGSNPIYKNRTEHDCNCCKQFMRAVGNIVAIVDGKIESIWDCKISEPAYQEVANAMAAYVKSKPIVDVFLHYEKSAGTEKSFAAMVGGGVHQWDHFHVTIPAHYVVRSTDIDTKLGAIRTAVQTTTRALTELDIDSVDVVLELINQNSLYRGADNKYAVLEFKKLLSEYNDLKAAKKSTFVWDKIKTIPGSVSGFRNTSIGTLVDDLSKGKELEDAVKSFESKVAGANYKRPTALVTKSMIDNAKKTLEKLGLTSALERRYAVLDDITVNNVIYANRAAKSVMTGDVFDQLGASVSTNPKKLDKVEEINIETFLSNVLPTASSIEVMVENRHSGNFVSLIAPTDATALPLFKWDNNFSWSYAGDVTDSIKEKVKAAGGNVSGELCCRLAWEYKDDLDFHMVEETIMSHNRNYEIYFGTRNITSPNGGRLDVDANGGSGQMEHPVENIFYNKVSSMKNGIYTLQVKNFSRRSDGVGFEVEIDLFGTVHSFVYDRVMKSGEMITVAKVIKDAEGIRVVPVLKGSESGGKSKVVWGVNTNTFTPVNVVMHSPNFWDGKGIGSKHYFFMVEGCANEEQTRGFYNEFLREELNVHRKVMEMVGGKLKTEKAEKQLSGLGFSSTMRNSVLVKVVGKMTRIVKVTF